MRSRIRIFLGIISTGILGIIIYPTVIFGHKLPDLGFLAWIYLVPLFIVLYQLKGKGRFFTSLFAAFLFYLGSLYWLIPAMHNFGGLGFYESLGVLILLSLMYAAYFGLALYLSHWTHEKTGFPLFVLNAVFLITFDLLRTYTPFNGFPWPMAGYSQGSFLSYLQWIDITGVFGLSFLIFLVNGIVADIIITLTHRGEKDHLLNRVAILVILMMVSFFGSYWQQKKMERKGEEVGNYEIALIQGNIPQDLKWDPKKARAHVKRYLELTEHASKGGAHLAIWPETAYPYTVDLSDLYDRRVFLREHLPIPVVMGAVSQLPAAFGKESTIHNSAFYVAEDARIRKGYHKMHLVPFGEYVPLKKLLIFARRLTVAVGDFSPGEEYSLLSFHSLKMAPLICYEDIFPAIARKFSKQGAHLLVNMTNDAWYGDTSAQYQHLVFSQFRALENRRYLVRATNTGVTAIIGPRGNIIKELAPFKEGILLRSIKLETRNTIYMLIGDLVAWLCIFAAVAALGYGIYRRSKGGEVEEEDEEV